MAKIVKALNTTNNTIVPDSDAIVSNALKSSDLGGSTTYYTNVSDLPISAPAFTKALVTSTNTLYQYNGGWYPIALINNFSPSFITEPNATYTLNSDGSATTVTVLAQDSDDVPVAYTVVTDSNFDAFATITHDSEKHNVWTITPTVSSGSFPAGTVTFRASDGVNLATVNSEFSIDFGPVGGAPLFYVESEGSGDKFGSTNQEGSTSFWHGLSISSEHIMIGAPSYSNNNPPKGKAYLYSWTNSGATLIRTHEETFYSFLGQQVAVNTTTGKYAYTQNYSTSGGADGEGKLSVRNISDGSLAWDINFNELSGSPTTIYWPGTWSDMKMTDSNLYIGHSASGVGNSAIRSYNVSNGTENWVVSNPSGTNFYFGTAFSVDESINRLITSEKGAGTNQRGEAYIYNTTNGSLLTTIANPEQSSGSDYDQFGGGVALKGNYCIIGAPGEDTGQANAGKVYIYSTSDNWATVSSVRSHTAPVSVTNGYWGYHVEISDTHYYVSNYLETSGGDKSGVIYVYKISDGSLEFTLGKTTDTFTSVANGNLGNDMALDGKNLLASQGYVSAGLARAYVFQ
jgi:hypothetical protein